MKYLIEKLVRDALAALPEELRPVDVTQGAMLVERTRDPTHGDFATNAALQLARAAKRKPRDLAQAMVVDALVPTPRASASRRVLSQVRNGTVPRRALGS